MNRSGITAVALMAAGLLGAAIGPAGAQNRPVGAPSTGYNPGADALAAQQQMQQRNQSALQEQNQGFAQSQQMLRNSGDANQRLLQQQEQQSRSLTPVPSVSSQTR